MAEIFISYTRAGRDYARRLANYLEDAGLSVWWDGILERLTQFEGLIQNQQYLPYSRFKLLPYFARVEQQTKAARFAVKTGRS
ncbi:MAG: toll/interleukin-1 receptor domain-containing protein [Rhodomicrobium sp.]